MGPVGWSATPPGVDEEVGHDLYELLWIGRRSKAAERASMSDTQRGAALQRRLNAPGNQGRDVQCAAGPLGRPRERMMSCVTRRPRAMALRMYVALSADARVLRREGDQMISANGEMLMRTLLKLRAPPVVRGG